MASIVALALIWVAYRYRTSLRIATSIGRIPSSSPSTPAGLTAQPFVVEKALSSAEVDELDRSTIQDAPDRTAPEQTAMPVESTVAEDRNHLASLAATAATTSPTASEPVFDSRSYRAPVFEPEEAERQQAIVGLGWALLEHRGSGNLKWADLPSESAERDDAANEFVFGLGQRDIQALAEAGSSGIKIDELLSDYVGGESRLTRKAKIHEALIALFNLAQKRSTLEPWSTYAGGDTPAHFFQLCRNILKGLGMQSAVPFKANGVDQAFHFSLTRRSTDGYFSTRENWLCAFCSGQHDFDRSDVDGLMRSIKAVKAGHLFFVTFGRIKADVDTTLRRTASQQHVVFVLIHGELAEALARDYAAARDLTPKPVPTGFSFAALRSRARNGIGRSWGSNLFHQVDRGSTLLICSPDAELLNIVAVAGTLGDTGPCIAVPLGAYQGNFWMTLCKALGTNGYNVSKVTAEALLSTGSVVLLLDVIDSVKDSFLQLKLHEELSHVNCFKPIPGTSEMRRVFALWRG